VRSFSQFFPKLGAHERCIAEAQVSMVASELTEGEWRVIAEQARFEAEVALCPDPLLYYRPPKKRHQPTRRWKESTATTGPAAPVASDDPLKSIPPAVYVEALTGEAVPENGWLNCPLPDHEDTTPSFQVLSSHWRCFGCGRGGGVIDLAAGLYGIEPRGRGYFELRDLIVEALDGAYLDPKEDR